MGSPRVRLFCGMPALTGMDNSDSFACSAAIPAAIPCARWDFSPCGAVPEGRYFRRGPAPQGRALNLPLRAGLAIEDRVVVSVLLVEDDTVVAAAATARRAALRPL